MDERPSGWYDDPDEPSRLRYWDGQSWTDRTHEKAPIPAPQEPKPVTRLRPVREPVEDEKPEPERGPAPISAADSPRPWASTADARSQAELAAAPEAPRGAYWRRALAALFDVALVWMISLFVMAFILTFSPDTVAAMDAYSQAGMQAIREGRPPADPSPMLMSVMETFVLVFAGLLVLYDAAQIMLSGSTLGGRITGIRVRPDTPDGHVHPARLLLRSILKYALFVFSGALSVIGLAFSVVNLMWPLNDARRRTLHDRWTGTHVVRRR